GRPFETCPLEHVVDLLQDRALARQKKESLDAMLRGGAMQPHPISGNHRTERRVAKVKRLPHEVAALFPTAGLAVEQSVRYQRVANARSSPDSEAPVEAFVGFDPLSRGDDAIGFNTPGLRRRHIGDRVIADVQQVGTGSLQLVQYDVEQPTLALAHPTFTRQEHTVVAGVAASREDALDGMPRQVHIGNEDDRLPRLQGDRPQALPGLSRTSQSHLGLDLEVLQLD